MLEAFLYAFLLGFALIGIIATGFYLILRIYSNYENCAYIVRLFEDMKVDEIADVICGAQVRIMLGTSPKMKVYVIDYGLDKDKRELASGLCRGYNNVEILEAEQFQNLMKR
ncbi:MAG: hypothetical protein IJM97_07105 [Clostridia bacterium]|nr:hypothetical protein [Clostridia bacterium]